MNIRMNDSDWINMWLDDKRAILACMADNMSDDLYRGGYNPAGNIIRNELDEMVAYAREVRKITEQWYCADGLRTDHEIALWCKRDMKRRGVIE